MARGAKISYASDGGNFEVAFRNIFAAVEKKAVDRVDDLLRKFSEILLARTPVFSGEMIHNWRWSTRAPNLNFEPAIEEPFQPGWHKGWMGTPLGAEPRRRANITRPRQSIAGALRANVPEDIYLTNASEHAYEVEAGLVKTRATPGFVRLTLKEVFGGYY